MKNHFRLLRGAMVAKGIDWPHAARALLIHPTTFSLKINAHYPWTQDEQYALMDLLDIPYNRMHEYFPRKGIPIENQIKTRKECPA